MTSATTGPDCSLQAITVPASALARGISGWLLLGAVAFTVLLFTVTRLVWRYALRHYTGASA